jgi:hypothetical protein
MRSVYNDSNNYFSHGWILRTKSKEKRKYDLSVLREKNLCKLI